MTDAGKLKQGRGVRPGAGLRKAPAFPKGRTLGPEEAAIDVTG